MARCVVYEVAHHHDGLAGHSNQLDEHDHVAEAEVSVQRAVEKHTVYEEEDEFHRRTAGHIHEVPVARLLLRVGDGLAVAFGEPDELSNLGDEGLDHLHLADDLCKTAPGEVNFPVLCGLDALPLFTG